jgi:hypothetical protein
MAPAFVSPYRESGKNDGNDAEAICEAVSRQSLPDSRGIQVVTTDTPRCADAGLLCREHFTLN